MAKEDYHIHKIRVLYILTQRQVQKITNIVELPKLFPLRFRLRTRLSLKNF